MLTRALSDEPAKPIEAVLADAGDGLVNSGAAAVIRPPPTAHPDQVRQRRVDGLPFVVVVDLVRRKDDGRAASSTRPSSPRAA